MKLGAFSISLTVKDINVSKAFYEKLGFTVFGGALEKNYLIMKNGNALVGLFQGMFEQNILTFNPGWDENAQKVDDFDDVRAIQKHVKAQGIPLTTEADETSSGPASFIIVDPDGNNINPAPVVDAARARALRSVPEVAGEAVAPFPDFETFADQLFDVVHGRPATSAEMVEVADQVTVEGIEAALAEVVNPNTTGGSLDRLYEAYFLRQADTEGFNYWMDQFRAGASLSQIAEWFAESEEFKLRYDELTFSDFLDQLYIDVLERDPDEEGKRYWLELLDSGQLNRGTIVVQFTQGQELINATRHRTELTLLSLVFTSQTPSLEAEQQWEILRAGSDLQSSVRSTYL